MKHGRRDQGSRSGRSALGRPARTISTVLLVAVAVLQTLLPSSSAVALMAKSRSGTTLHWGRPAIELTVVEPHRQSGLTVAVLRDALRSGITVWNDATRDCKVPRLGLSDIVEKRNWLAQDGRSLVMVQSQAECSNEENASPLCMEKEVAARTHFYPHHVSERQDDGLVEEADLELSAVAYQWVLDGSGDGKASLRRTIHHELGHVLGLDHPCEMHASGGASQERGIPICKKPEMERLLMHPAAAVTDKTVSLAPSAADIAELCHQYGEKSWLSRLLGDEPYIRLAHYSFLVGVLVVALLVGRRRRSGSRS